MVEIADYQSGTCGARSDPLTGRSLVPQFQSPAGTALSPTAKFDGVDGTNLIDRKTNVVWTDEVVDETRRQAGVAAHDAYAVVWELPTEKVVAAAQRFLSTRAGVSTISVRDVP